MMGLSPCEAPDVLAIVPGTTMTPRIASAPEEPDFAMMMAAVLPPTAGSDGVDLRGAAPVPVPVPVPQDSVQSGAEIAAPVVQAIQVPPPTPIAVPVTATAVTDDIAQASPVPVTKRAQVVAATTPHAHAHSTESEDNQPNEVEQTVADTAPTPIPAPAPTLSLNIRPVDIAVSTVAAGQPVALPNDVAVPDHKIASPKTVRDRGDVASPAATTRHLQVPEPGPIQTIADVRISEGTPTTEIPPRPDHIGSGVPMTVPVQRPHADKPVVFQPDRTPHYPAFVADVARDVLRVSGDADVRFNVRPEMLGPVAVTIEKSDAGPMLHLGVETQAALQAVRQAEPLLNDARSAVPFVQVTVDMNGPDSRSRPRVPPTGSPLRGRHHLSEVGDASAHRPTGRYA